MDGNAPRDGLTPKVIPLEAGPGGRQRLLKGAPETAGMRSGMVVLPPGASVGRHDTGAHEEQLLILEGEGELRVEGSEPLPIAAGVAAYCPPHSLHDVVNTGSKALRYIYVVADAR